jgi:hippurate hydrolase
MSKAIVLTDRVKFLHSEMKEWMDYMHANPELSMEEYSTAGFIADKLTSWGYTVVDKVGKHGVVASLTVGDGEKSIGLRADFDALPIQEENNLSYKSTKNGVAHLCGHDAHSTMLLCAAKYLAENRNFNGTVRLIFQPAEETMQGAKAMIEDGLWERFPVDTIYAMHNMPGFELGKFYFREGETMAAVDNWEIVLTGKGSHGSTPDLGVDPIVCGASLVMALQTIVSRNVSPWNNCVVNVGSFQSGQAGNAVPQRAILRVSIRNMDKDIRKLVLKRIRTIVKAQSESFNCEYEIIEGIAGSVLVNTLENTQWSAKVATNIFGEENVVYGMQPLMGREDFAFMLEDKPGSYCMIGNGESQMLHHPSYIFNQDLLPIGAEYWVGLVQEYLTTS